MKDTLYLYSFSMNVLTLFFDDFRCVVVGLCALLLERGVESYIKSEPQSDEEDMVSL